MSDAPQTSLEVRSRLVEALKLDLVGPPAGHELEREMLPGRVRPSLWYLTGFLIPTGTPPEKAADIDEDEDLELVPEHAGEPEESPEDRKAAKKGFFPSSMGISFLVAAGVRQLDVAVRWGDYRLEDGLEAVWERTPHEEKLEVPLAGSAEPVPLHVPDSGGLQLFVLERTIEGDLAGQLPPGTRSVSLFLVNHRPPAKEEIGPPDLAYAFQAELEVRGAGPFVPRPDVQDPEKADWDEQVADLHYADAPEYAAGHAVSAEWELDGDGRCSVLRTSWIPAAEVEKTEAVTVEGCGLSMDDLGSLADGAAARSALQPLVEAYGGWIEARRADLSRLRGRRLGTAEELLRLAGVARKRIGRGIETLENDADALDAFRMANRAVARALVQRNKLEDPRWHPFQLAFILLNLPGLADPRDAEREIVDLLFFPTGGGKTEAYLGLAAFAMVLRRLRHRDEKEPPGAGAGAGAGVSVIMRYTLRLLTLDQLGRAAGLVCALELERLNDESRYGAFPFEIGLWVGKAATPNHMGRKGDGREDTARTKVNQYKANPSGKPSPIPLESCPWCKAEFTPDSFTLLPDADKPADLRVVCQNFECEFSGERGLPILSVDEPIYRRLPAFLIATVDKFASLPFVGESGALLGSERRGIAPPDLIIQDELHLISGPLGTMAGLYETAIEALCIREVDGKQVRPKIIASTATVRRAQDQIQALFARSLTQIFPPPGPDRRDSFFAKTRPAAEVPARLYLGIASQGRSPKVTMRKAWLALMGAAERSYRDAGGHKNENNPADPYMTVVGYFNSLRELGGARRILEEEVQNTVGSYGMRKRVGETEGLFHDRTEFSEVMELTSRVPTDKVAEARQRLGAPFSERDQRVDCAIATNMISVGLDIPRLGLMVVVGQPKVNAEYIQATSRVGRTDERPGLIVTVLNMHKPRDRSHYERFRHYHETFYRSVEAGSITPFSARALDHGFTGALVALSRHAVHTLTPPEGAARIADVRTELEKRLLSVFQARVERQPMTEKDRAERLFSVQTRVADLLDSWVKVVEDNAEAGVRYQKYEGQSGACLLRERMETGITCEHAKKFRVNRSLRDVEPDVNVFLKDLDGVEVGTAE